MDKQGEGGWTTMYVVTYLLPPCMTLQTAYVEANSEQQALEAVVIHHAGEYIEVKGIEAQGVLQ